MKYLYTGFCVLLITFYPLSGYAQTKILENTLVEVTYAKKQGRSKAISDLVPREQTNRAKKADAKRDRLIPKNFIGRYKNRIIKPKLEHRGEDRLWQKFISKSQGNQIIPKVNIDGLNSGGSPHDPTGDVGKDYYMQSVNVTQIGIYTKKGELVMDFAANTLWNALGFNSGGDPIIIYDQEVERWLITEFPSGFGGSANQLLVAVSVTGNPMGEYDVYSFNTTRFPDYPKYGVWTNSYSVTTNEEGAGTLHGYFINKDQLLQGEELVEIQRVAMPGNSNTEAGFFVGTPVDWTGLTPPPAHRNPLIVSLNDASWNVGQQEDQIEFFSIDIDWENPALTHVSQRSVEVSPYDAYPCSESGFYFECLPQKGGGAIDGIPETIMNQVHYRNFGQYEAIVMNFITDVSDGENLSGIRWIEFRRTESEDWSVYQEGTFAPHDGLHRMMGGICMDKNGNIALAYNVTSDTSYIGIRATGRRASDPLGVMTLDELIVAEGENPIVSGTRFGDYAHMSIDPIDDRTFWYTTEYAKAGTSYTRIVAYELSKDTFDMGPLSLISPFNSGDLDENEMISFSVENFGLDTIHEFKLGYILDNSMEVTDSVNFELLPDSIYVHTFDRMEDMSELGIYRLKLFTSISNDQAPANDTTLVYVEKLAKLDATISNIVNIENLVCGDSTDVFVEIQNLGLDSLFSINISIELNSDFLVETRWQGQLGPNETEAVKIPVPGLVNGENMLSVYLHEPNNSIDQIPDNDVKETSIYSEANTVTIYMELLLDEFPAETSWNLTNESGFVLYEGGPYGDQESESTIQQEFCLNPDSCYIFTIFDEFGDGITAYGTDGYYQLSDEEGHILSALIEVEFGSFESNDFCASFSCNLQAESSVSPDYGSGDGMVIVSVNNGVGPYMYSLDGTNFQGSPAFDNLIYGSYDITVIDANGCEISLNAEISECSGMIEIVITKLNSGTENSSQIEIITNGIDSVVSFSIDGGVTTSTSPLFENIPEGEYQIVVLDTNGCVYTETAIISMSTSVFKNVSEYGVKLYPNPTEGHFLLELNGLEHDDVFLPVSIFNSEGRVIQRTQLSLYNSTFKGMISLHAYPVGKYYLKIHNDSIDRLIRVINI